MKLLDLFSGTYACSDSLNPDFSVTTASACVTPRRVATMTACDSIERGAADECEPLRGRRPRTFTLTQLLVACVAVCVCAIAATTVVSTHGFRPNLAESSRLYKLVCHNVHYVGDCSCNFHSGCGCKVKTHRVCHKVRDFAAEARRDALEAAKKLEAVAKKLQQCDEQRKQCLLQPAHDSRLCDEQRKQCIERAKIH